MKEIMELLSSWFSILPRITVTNIIEIIIIAILVYVLLVWIKTSRAWLILRGLAVVLAFIVFCAILRLDTLLFIMGKLATIAAMALIVIFQPELRHALEQLGSGKLISRIVPMMEIRKENALSVRVVNEIVKAAFEMGKAYTGALITIECKDSLDNQIRSGIEIGGKVSSQLLINLFQHNTPMHDGAVIVRGDTIVAATCYLPLSDNTRISKSLGTRHRAAIGMSEVSDSVTVVVSEETGAVSCARNGEIETFATADQLRDVLMPLAAVEDKSRRFKLRRVKGENEKAADE